jgi:quercetin dioxygenase-like cupin family protein
MREAHDHEWGSMVWHTEADPAAELSLAEMTIRAGCTSPPHRHPNCEEMVFVRHGAVGLVVDGLRRDLGAGESARVGRGVAHQMIAGDVDAALVLVWSAAQRDYEAVTPEG